MAGALARATAIVGLLTITVIGIPWAIRQLVRYQFLAQTTMLEGLRPTAALKRSSELVAGRWFHTAVVVILLGALVSLTNAVVGLLLLVILVGLPLWLFSILIATAAALVIPFSAIGNVMLYGDAKAEHEHLDQAEPIEESLTT